MASIKNLETGEVIEVADVPQWINGVWECGNLRFTDPTQTTFAPVAAYAIVPADSFYTFRLSVAERVKARASTDAEVIEVVRTLDMWIAKGNSVDPNLPLVQGMIQMLADKGLLDAHSTGLTERVHEILAGI